MPFIRILLLVVMAGAKAPDFNKTKIRLEGKTISVELADNDERREYGLMFRKSLPVNDGMLFVFDREQPLSFWMKNTRIPLSIGYFDKDKRLVETLEMVPAIAMVKEPVLYPSRRNVLYALEMNKGWFAKNKVKTGAKFSFTEGHSNKP